MIKSLPIIEQESPARAAIGFDEKLARHNLELRAASVDVLQVNVGKLCNQACKHCHVDASPKRTEIMSVETAEQILATVRRFKIPTLDITGGAPELNASFRRLVSESRAAGTRVIVRHNLTVMFEPGQADLPEFSATIGWRSFHLCRISFRRKPTRSAGKACLINQSKRCAA